MCFSPCARRICSSRDASSCALNVHLTRLTCSSHPLFTCAVTKPFIHVRHCLSSRFCLCRPPSGLCSPQFCFPEPKFCCGEPSATNSPSPARSYSWRPRTRAGPAYSGLRLLRSQWRWRQQRRSGTALPSKPASVSARRWAWRRPWWPWLRLKTRPRQHGAALPLVVLQVVTGGGFLGLPFTGACAASAAIASRLLLSPTAA